MKNSKRTFATTIAGIGLALCTVVVASPAMATDDIPEPVAATSMSVVSQGQPATASAENSVRGTFATITNESGATIKIGTASDNWDKAPKVTKSDLANGASTTVSQGSTSSSGTSIFAEITFSDGTSQQLAIENPAIGYPEAMTRDAKWGVIDWQFADYDSHNFDENESWTCQLPNNHSISFTRNADDSAGHSDSKVWTVTVK